MTSDGKKGPLEDLVSHILKSEVASGKPPEPRDIATINAEINNAQMVLDLLHDERKGRMLDDTYGYCASCGIYQVDAAGGYDTCSTCMSL